METEERRSFERLDKQAVVHYRQIETIGDEGLFFTGNLLDCSGGGIRFVAHQEYEKNTQLQMELEFDGWIDEGDEWAKTGNSEDVGLLNVIGQVMWCVESEKKSGDFEIGVLFTGTIK